MPTDVIVVGAGWAGLACARRLIAAGVSIRVLERSDRPGGRASTRSLGGYEFDFGPVFVHGEDPAFFDDLAVPLKYWPLAVRGTGTPCQPEAFVTTQNRGAVVGGLGQVALGWARELDLTLGFDAVSWTWDPAGISVLAADGRREQGRHIVWALAAEQTKAILETLEGTMPHDAVSAAGLLALAHSLPSLTVLAIYDDPPPSFDIWYPERSPLLLVSNESAKRGVDRALLVLQSRAAWAAERFEVDRETWAQELLASAVPALGDWVERPRSWHTHRWRYGRLEAHDRLTTPLLLTRPETRSLVGITGDLFDVSGGLQGAWKAGRAMADRLLSQR